MDLAQLADEVFEAVIFDLDGTLIDSTPAVLRAWSAWESEYGLAPMDLLLNHGTPSASVVRTRIPEHLQEAATRRITELEMANLHDVVVLPGDRGSGVVGRRQERNRHIVHRTAGGGSHRGRAARATLGAGDGR